VAVQLQTGDSSYGPLQAQFDFFVPDGYGVLVGANNSGQSALLQLAFRTAFDDPGVGAGRVCLILPDRTQLSASTETGGRSLEDYNSDLVGWVRATDPLSYENLVGPSRGELARALLNHTDFEHQLQDLQGLLGRLGLPRLVLRASQRLHFGDVPGQFQGSGLRALLPILCSLTDPSLRVILIDEPEEALEPRLQKALRDLLIERASQRSVLVCTHSHLFLNRREASSNFRVSQADGRVAVEPLASDEELYDVAFKLLGSSTEDLFFPANYLLVEGASDQIVVERVLALLDIPHGKIKVVSAGGIDAARDTLRALNRALLPLVMRDSPYAKRVVALIDRPSDPASQAVAELRRVLGDRLVVLDEPSLEEAIPSAIYERVGLVRSAVLEELGALRGDYVALHDAKRQISRRLAQALEVEDLHHLSRLHEVATRAFESVEDAR
jgi:hypothetical protein